MLTTRRLLRTVGMLSLAQQIESTLARAKIALALFMITCVAALLSLIVIGVYFFLLLIGR